MPKQVITKTKICISIDKSLYYKLKKHCDANLIKFSTYLEYLIKKGETSNKTILIKKSPKIKISVSIDKKIHSRLKKHCNANLIKLSTYIEYLVKKGDRNES